MKKPLIYILMFLILIISVSATITYTTQNNSPDMTHFRSLDPTRVCSTILTNNFNNVTGNYTIVNITQPTNNNCYTSYIISSAGTILSSAGFVSNVATHNYKIHPNLKYYLAIDSNGTACNVYDDTTPSFPYTNNIFNYTSSSYSNTCGSDLGSAVFGVSQAIIKIDTGTTIEPTYNVSLTSLQDINTSTLFINLTSQVINTTNANMTNTSMLLYYGIKTGLNNGCSIYYQKTCVSDGSYKSKSMTKTNQTSFYTLLTDTDIFPAYYPFNYSIIDNSIHLNDTIYKANNIVFNVTNFSTNVTSYNILVEFSAVSQLTSSNLLIYYCNSSYINSEPSTNSNCVLIDSFNPTTIYQHRHNQSKHQGIPVVINGITKTQQSYFIFRSNAVNTNNGWNFEYITDTTYNNQSFKVCSDNFVCSNTNKIYDIHIHPFLSSDYLSLYSVLNDNTVLTSSNIISDFYNLTHYPPQAVQILNPLCNEQFTLSENIYKIITFNWTISTSINNLDITYNLSLRNDLDNDMYLINQLSDNYYYVNFTSEYINSGNYRVVVDACDELNLCDKSIQTCSFNICYNDYMLTTTPCVSNSQQLIYYDNNACNELLDFPILNNTYVSCITPPTQINYSFSEEQIIFVSLLLFILVSIIGGIAINTIFFYLTALLIGFLASIQIYYHYPHILIVSSFILLIMFVIIAIFSKNRGN